MAAVQSEPQSARTTDVGPERRHDLDAVRGYTILVVVVYHVFYLLNSSGLASQIPVGRGIHAFDVIAAFPYPWIMVLLFTVAGISARYSLMRRTPKQFIGERARKLLVPLFGAWTLLGWVLPLVWLQFTDPFAETDVPAPVRVIVYWSMGQGVLWFLFELFICSLVLLVVRQVDRRDRIFANAGRMPLWALIALAVPVWGSSLILNAPYVVVVRFGIYPLAMLLGYFVLANPDVLARLKTAAPWLLGGAVLLGCGYAWLFWGQNWVSDTVLHHPLTNLYAWVAVLGILGGAARWLNQPNRFVAWLRVHSFPVYVVHYNVTVVGAWVILRFLGGPMPASYVLLLVFTAVGTAVFVAATVRVPVLRFLLYGIRSRHQPTAR